MEIKVKPEINMGHVNIPVSVNGQGPFSFVLDTGASITTIGKRLAEKLGIPKGARAIGAALGKNPIPIIVPCHRVLRSGGKIGGFSAGIEVKKRLLSLEAESKD